MPSRAALEDLINVALTILVRSFEVLKSLLEVLDVRFELRCLARQPLVDFSCRAENKPANET